jgi:hypothetical protein
MPSRSNGPVRRTAGQWRQILTRFERSGLSVQAFCDREGLSASSFQRWRAKLAAGRDSFVQLALPTPAEPRASDPESIPWNIELELPGDVILRIWR